MNFNDSTFKHIVENDNPTVIEIFQSKNNKLNYSNYSEKQIEDKFLSQLEQQGYERLFIKNHDELLDNFKKQIEKINNIKFSDNDWSLILNDWILKDNNFISAQKKFQVNYVESFTLENGETKNITLIDKFNIHKNTLQFIQQYKNEYTNKIYDVLILFNGFPICIIELKKPNVNIQNAFNQINSYRDLIENNSNLLFSYLQLFIISNVDDTFYFANSQKVKNNKLSNSRNSFKFTIHWSDSKNNKIENLFDFTETFLSKHTFLNMICNYFIFKNNEELLIMRPYQIVATERIINRINYAINNRNILGTKYAGGYVWHSTGSGKTITSFKTAELVNNKFISIDDQKISKVLFVVDRLDLDTQTFSEYNKLRKDFADSTNSTKDLGNKLSDYESKVIITTIQKLTNFIKENSNHEIYNKPIVIIFDECHRTQFGSMHSQIKNKFKEYCMFGFTGTPIFSENSSSTISSTEIAKNIDKNYNILNKTTDDLFGTQLHVYNILDAINDGSVLKFQYQQPTNIVNNSDLLDDNRIKNITNFIIKNFKYYTKKENGIKGYNSLLATSSVDHAIKYYNQFKDIDNDLKIFSIFSTSNYDKLSDVDYDEDTESIDKLNLSHREKLIQIINDYNVTFNTNFSLDSKDGFKNFYKDVSLKMKNQEIDILIVVNMFLTGFDAPTLNTLWLDKNLQKHNLLQAFARTNRLHSEIKQAGQIISFLDLKEKMDESIKLFSNGSEKVILMYSFDEYYNGYYDNVKCIKVKGYKEIVDIILKNFPEFEKSINLTNKNDFLNIFNDFLQSWNIVKAFPTDFNNEKQILTQEQISKYTSIYRQLYDEWQTNKNDNNESLTKSSKTITPTFHIELLSFTNIDVKYILNLIGKKIMNSNSQLDSISFKNELSTILKASNNFYKTPDFFLEFYDYLLNSDVFNNKELSYDFIINEFERFKSEKLHNEIICCVEKYDLKKEETIKFIMNSIRDNSFKSYGLDIKNLMNKKEPLFSRGLDTKPTEKLDNLKNDLYSIWSKYVNY